MRSEVTAVGDCGGKHHGDEHVTVETVDVHNGNPCDASHAVTVRAASDGDDKDDDILDISHLISDTEQSDGEEREQSSIMDCEADDGQSNLSKNFRAREILGYGWNMRA